MKLPLTRQKRTEENRLEEAQQLLNEIEAAGSYAKPETARFADEGIALAFGQSIEGRALAWHEGGSASQRLQQKTS